MRDLSSMSLAEVAGVVADDWRPVWFGAVPYLQAMATLDSVDDSYGYDSGRSVVTYFLSNARTWKGDTARAVKAELKRRVRS